MACYPGFLNCFCAQERGRETLKKKLYLLFLLTALGSVLTGCSRQDETEERLTEHQNLNEIAEESTDQEAEDAMNISSDREEFERLRTRIEPVEEITELEDGLSVVRYEGDYGFDHFLEQGGASSDAEVVEYVSSEILSNITSLIFGGRPFGCSTLQVENEEGGWLFGRNFDWNTCHGLIVSSRPEEGYASVSTVNMDFISADGVDISTLPDSVQAAVGLYAPLDGMNEEGLAVSVNMIQDSATIEQDTGKPDLTTTTAVRLLLDRAANVEEALDLLGQYDLHASMGMMVHFALADASGRSVVVEYIDNEMTVTDTKAVTNFYLAEGEKYGIGTAQSHERYEILNQAIAEQERMTELEVRDALDSVSKDNFGDEFASTEWSIVMNQETKELTYFHRENYENGYTIAVE